LKESLSPAEEIAGRPSADGFLEDRRPNAKMDPCVVTQIITETCYSALAKAATTPTPGPSLRSSGHVRTAAASFVAGQGRAGTVMGRLKGGNSAGSPKRLRRVRCDDVMASTTTAKAWYL
jgi:hypothetical protein